MKVKIKINDNNDDLWCSYTKDNIPLGDPFIEVVVEEFGEEISKVYSTDRQTLLFLAEEDDIYLYEDELGETNFYEAEGFDSE